MLSLPYDYWVDSEELYQLLWLPEYRVIGRLYAGAILAASNVRGVVTNLGLVGVVKVYGCHKSSALGSSLTKVYILTG